MANNQYRGFPWRCLCAAAVCVLVVCGCSAPARDEVRAGDLYFVVLPAAGVEEGSMDAAIAQATAEVVHVAIAVSADSIIDATPRHGVALRSREVLAQENPEAHIVVRHTSSLPQVAADRVVSAAYSLVGCDYDLYFMPDNGKYYCSELVQYCFGTAPGESLFPSAPMNFYAGADAAGRPVLPAFWQRLFDSLQCAVPQGVPGTNPADMLRWCDTLLRAR